MSDFHWKHVKSGGVYRVTGHVLIEATCTPAFVYSLVSGGPSWVRPMTEFLDGRFVPVMAEVPA